MANKATAKPMTKSEVVSGIAGTTGLTKKQVGSVFEAMAGQIKKSLGRNGPGAYAVPGLMKVIVVRKPATKARKGINRFTGEVDRWSPTQTDQRSASNGSHRCRRPLWQSRQSAPCSANSSDWRSSVRS